MEQKGMEQKGRWWDWGGKLGLVSYVYLSTYFLYCERMCEDCSSSILLGEVGGEGGG